MSRVERLLKRYLGAAQLFMLKRALRNVQISLDVNERCLVIYQEACDPVEIPFDQIEAWVNNAH